MQFNPYTGKPRAPKDIRSDPEGKMVLDPDSPIANAESAADLAEALARTWGLNAGPAREAAAVAFQAEHRLGPVAFARVGVEPRPHPLFTLEQVERLLAKAHAHDLEFINKWKDAVMHQIARRQYK